MSTLAAYRARVPAHASVPDALVETYLADAAAAHTSTAWGSRYAEAMVSWAAHHLELLPGSGADGLARDGSAPVVPEGAGRTVGPVASARQGDQSTSYAAPRPTDEGFEATVYGRRYLAIRASRAASAPRVVTVGT